MRLQRAAAPHPITPSRIAQHSLNSTAACVDNPYPAALVWSRTAHDLLTLWKGLDLIDQPHAARSYPRRLLPVERLAWSLHSSYLAMEATLCLEELGQMAMRDG